ncbi:MAG: DUF3494 domain-containing protein [Planctomycetes bacterium]|nr:DUF3494 domain-containing protein [Planctomycetota bacterium]
MVTRTMKPPTTITVLLIALAPMVSTAGCGLLSFLGIPDTTAPTVNSVIPSNAATDVKLNQSIKPTFSEAMNPTTITTTNFTVAAASIPVTGTVTYQNNIATFTPTIPLAPGTTFTATISTGSTDVAGNPLAQNFVWSFTTGTSVAPDPSTPAQAPVDLRSAAGFAVLAGSAVSNNAGATIINGDLGVSPSATVNGFPPGVVNGTIHAANPTAAQAQLDLTTAFLDAQGRSTDSQTLPGNLGGLTFAPGLYTNSTSVLISGSGPGNNVTLDAQGNANAVFIFQMGSTLTTGPGSQVILSGDAKAANVYWQIGTSATLDTTSIFKGNMLALTSITLKTGATLDGRALARNGAVTLDSNTITTPSP